MMAPPRIGMAEDAQLAPTFSWANSDAARGERARDQRVLHAERNRVAGGPVPIWCGHAARRGITNRLSEDVWPATRQTAARACGGSRASVRPGGRIAAGPGHIARVLLQGAARSVSTPTERARRAGSDIAFQHAAKSLADLKTIECRARCSGYGHLRHLRRYAGISCAATGGIAL